MSINSPNSTMSTKESTTPAGRAVRTRESQYQECLDAAAARGFERIGLRRSQSWNEGKVYHGLHIRVICGRRLFRVGEKKHRFFAPGEPCQHMRLC